MLSLVFDSAPALTTAPARSRDVRVSKICKPAARKQCLSYTRSDGVNRSCSPMLKYSTGLRAKSSTGWFPWVFCPCSLQGRLHFSSLRSHQLLLCLFTCAPLAPSPHNSVSGVPNTALPQGVLGHSGAERGGAGANVPTSISSREQHEGRSEEEKEGERDAEKEGGRQLAGVWLCGRSSCLGEPRRAGM